jgi:hypothetical protein
LSNNNHEIPNNENLKIAGKTFDPSDYQSNSIESNGLAVTHEQTTDTLTEGTIEAKIDDVNGKDIEIPRTGYDQDKI